MDTKEFRYLLQDYAIANQDMGYLAAGGTMSNVSYRDALKIKERTEKEIINAINQSRINRKSTEGESKTN